MPLRIGHPSSDGCRLGPGPAGSNPMTRLARDPIVRAVLQQQSLVAGEFAPDFAGTAAGGAPCDLGEMLASGPVLLHFDHGAWCATCLEELDALIEAWRQLQPEAASFVVATMSTSPNDPASAGPPGLRRLWDRGGHIAGLYGLLLHVPSSIAVQMAPLCDLPDVSGDGDYGYAVPATIVINKLGIAELCQIDPDHSLGRPAATTMKCLDGLLNRK